MQQRRLALRKRGLHGPHVEEDEDPTYQVEKRAQDRTLFLSRPDNDLPPRGGIP